MTWGIPSISMTTGACTRMDCERHQERLGVLKVPERGIHGISFKCTSPFRGTSQSWYSNSVTHACLISQSCCKVAVSPESDIFLKDQMTLERIYMVHIPYWADNRSWYMAPISWFIWFLKFRPGSAVDSRCCQFASISTKTVVSINWRSFLWLSFD